MAERAADRPRARLPVGDIVHGRRRRRGRDLRRADSALGRRRPGVCRQPTPRAARRERRAGSRLRRAPPRAHVDGLYRPRGGGALSTLRRRRHRERRPERRPLRCGSERRRGVRRERGERALRRDLERLPAAAGEHRRNPRDRPRPAHDGRRSSRGGAPVRVPSTRSRRPLRVHRAAPADRPARDRTRSRGRRSRDTAGCASDRARSGGSSGRLC